MPSKIVVGTPFFVVFEGKRMNKAGEFLGKNLVYGCIKLLEQWKLAISGICTKISIPCLPNRYIITFKFLQTRAFSITPRRTTTKIKWACNMLSSCCYGVSPSVPALGIYVYQLLSC